MGHRHRFCLRQSLSPTYFNVVKHLQSEGFRYTRFNWLSRFNEKNFQFNSIAAESLEFKHLLTTVSLSVLSSHYAGNILY